MNDVEMKQRLTADLDRRLDDVARRLDGAVTRAGIVIPTAIVIAALPHAGDSWIRSGFLLATFFLAGLVILYRDGPQVPVRRLARRANSRTDSPSTRASLRISANTSTLDLILASSSNHTDETTFKWGQIKPSQPRRQVAKWGQI
jgi:hypothetical protein